MSVGDVCGLAERHAPGQTGGMSMRRALLSLALLVAALPANGSDAAAQASVPSGGAASAGPLYPRPRLVSGADTNEAINYFLAGEGRLVDDPESAVAAAYWAERLDPGSSRAPMLRWRATWLASPQLLRRLYRDPAGAMKDSATRAAVARIDSLYLRALHRDPFEVVDPSLRKNPSPAPPEVVQLLKKRPNDVELRVYEATRHYRRQEYDSAVAYVRAALAILERRQREAKQLERVYLSRTLFHFAAGRALEAAGKLEAAQEAYGAALAEELGFAPAHAALARIAWRDFADTAAARREYAMALELADDPVVRLAHARMLLAIGEPEAAVAEVERSVAAAPDFAEAYDFCGEANASIGRIARAITCYRGYLARAPRRLDAARAATERRIASLETMFAPQSPE